MKKFLFVISIFIFILAFSSVFATDSIVISPQKVLVNGIQKSFEVYNINGNNFFKLRDIAYVLNNTDSQFFVDYNSEKQMIELKKSKSYISVGGEMVTGTDKSSTAVKSSQKLSIDGALEDLVAYNIGGNNFFKLRDLGLALDFKVDFDSNKNSVIIESKKKEEIVNITNVVTKIFDGVMYVEVETGAPVDSYNVFSLTDPDRIILDISNSNLKIDSNIVNTNYGGITTVRMGNQGNNINRIVVDLEKSSEYKVLQSPDKKITCLALSKNIEYAELVKTPEKVLLVYNGSLAGMTGIQKPIEPDKPIEQPPVVGEVSGEKDVSGESAVSGDSNVVEKDKVLTEDELKNRIKISSVKYSAVTDKLKITGNKTLNSESFLLDNPYRLVIDIENSVLDVEGPKEITPNNKNISSIRFSQNSIDVVRIVIDLKSECEYEVKENGTTIEVELEEINVGKLQYEVSKKYAKLTLYDVSKGIFKTSESSKNNTYTLKYSVSKFNPKEELLDIDDDFVENIKVESGKIIITGTGYTEYEMKRDGNNVVIKMELGEEVKKEEAKEDSEEDFIVLLDAGHGGSDPGACNGENYEKVYNLAIMLKLMEMLEDTEGVKVYASRTDDTYLSREDRVAFATSYDEADLFVSVHNNSVANKNYTGTMVLYYDNVYEKDYGITSKEFAKIVLEELVTDLGTRDWGTISRDDLHVLYYSELPSILCEVAFVSNDEEVERLKTEEFQETAARAIYNGIMLAREKMNK